MTVWPCGPSSEVWMYLLVWICSSADLGVAMSASGESDVDGEDWGDSSLGCLAMIVERWR